jgi:hypothetical protein
MMLLRAALTLLAAGFLAQAPCQNGPSAKPTKQIPDNVIYEFFFQRVAALDDLGSQLDANGKSGKMPRGQVQAEAQLSPAEAQALKAVAADCRSLVAATKSAAQPLIDAARGQAAVSGAPSPSTRNQLRALQKQREKIVEDHIQQLKQAIGGNRFGKLDAYVRRTTAVQASVLDLPAKSNQGKQ